MGHQNTSEKWFEEYLTAHGLADWKRIPEGDGKRPDYEVTLDGTPHYFEVKEFETEPPHAGFGAFDPYAPIRAKINKAVPQFKQYTNSPCCIVLANPKQAFVMIEEPMQVWGAMFGNLGYSVPFDPGAVGHVEVTNVFLRGGKLIDDGRKQALNARVSALIVLGKYNVRQKKIKAAWQEREANLGRNLNPKEVMDVCEALPDASDLHPLRIRVFENPFARLPLSRDYFRGPFDERWGDRGDSTLSRLFIGSEAKRFDVEE